MKNENSRHRRPARIIGLGSAAGIVSILGIAAIAAVLIFVFRPANENLGGIAGSNPTGTSTQADTTTPEPEVPTQPNKPSATQTSKPAATPTATKTVAIDTTSCRNSLRRADQLVAAAAPMAAKWAAYVEAERLQSRGELTGEAQSAREAAVRTGKADIASFRTAASGYQSAAATCSTARIPNLSSACATRATVATQASQASLNIATDWDAQFARTQRYGNGSLSKAQVDSQYQAALATINRHLTGWFGSGPNAEDRLGSAPRCEL